MHIYRILQYRTLHAGILFCLILFTTVTAFAGDVTLSWDAPTTNEDGTPLSDLAGYIVYYGTSSGNYTTNINVGNVTTYQITNLADGLTYYFAVTAYDTVANQSSYSTEVSTTLQSPSDTTPPVISGIYANGITTDSAAVNWTTNEIADSQVEYGTSS